MNAQFSRRTFLRTATLASAASALPVFLTPRGVAQNSGSSQPRNASIYRFKLGNFRMMSISDGILNAPAALFAGNATPQQLSDVLRQSFQSESLNVDCNILFVDTGSHKVLIDTGSGVLAGATAGRLIENLALAYINTADIDTIIITHAHADHVGGLTDQAGSLVFPNARYFVSNPEWSFWTQPQVSLPKLKGGDQMAKQFISVAQKQFGAIRGKVIQFGEDRDIIPGFSAIPTPGHTPGHVALRITSGNASLIHTADVVHTHTINLWHPDWQPVFDADPEQAAQIRQTVLAQIAADRSLMFAYHFPFPGIGHLRPRTKGGFDWERMNWQFEV